MSTIDQLSDLMGSIELVDFDLKVLEDFYNRVQECGDEMQGRKITILLHTSEDTSSTLEIGTADQCLDVTGTLIECLQNRRNELKKSILDIIHKI